MTPANGDLKPHLGMYPRSGHSSPVNKEFPEASPKTELNTVSSMENAGSQANKEDKLSNEKDTIHVSQDDQPARSPTPIYRYKVGQARDRS